MNDSSTELAGRWEGSFLLFRVDDRLLHGQVTVGWGTRLEPETYVIVDDEAAADDLSTALFSAVAPEGTRVEVIDVRAFLRVTRPSDAMEKSILLVRSLQTAAELLREGVPGPVNLGGLHAHPGATPFLDYIHLNEADCALLRELNAEGFQIEVRDLPGTPTRTAASLLDE